MKSRRALLLLAVLAAGSPSATARAQPQTESPADRFFRSVAGLCGKAFAGKIVANQPTPTTADPFEGQSLVFHVRGCGADRLELPFHVGEDRSRTWVITRTAEGLRLKHDHRHADGSPDALTMYGGDTAEPGTAGRQAFPVDEESRRMFSAQGREVSNTNTWGMEVEPGRVFVYELRRPPVADGQPGRHFRVEFDLTRPVAPPPPPWGAEAPSGAALPDRHE